MTLMNKPTMTNLYKKESFLNELSFLLFELTNNTNEWYLSDFYDSKIKPLSTSTSFELVSEVMSIIELNIYKKDFLYDAIYILNQLYRHSDTTETPTYLVNNPDFFTRLTYEIHDQDAIQLLIETVKIF
ncbi:hypothetical protein [Acinetobacter pollinis]|uniref:Uncharacterized protein n=1 Tax=Acinetobacter pollinis TaxID=2605270 RepID=A0ABU6DWN8_9GAMM|nr:hypothetical protein [Acinetobacter pollinis]MEB5477891.1 hypothetical protein [Acinetobacter pollinis]